MRRNWLIAALVVGIAAIVVAVVASRLASDDADDLESWAESVCTSVADWRASILALADVSGGLTADSLRDRIDDGEAATEELVSDLRDLGAPDVESGDELQDELEATATTLRDEYEALRTDAQAALDAGSSTEFLQALATLAPRFQTLLHGAASVLDELESAPDVATETREELRTAFDDAEACQQLRRADRAE